MNSFWLTNFLLNDELGDFKTANAFLLFLY